MTEDDAKLWLGNRGWYEGLARTRLDALVELVLAGNREQNLVARSTEQHIWARHIVDSAQLVELAGRDGGENGDGSWIDIGSGGGFPGLVIGCLRQQPLALVETRGLRVAFLKACVQSLNLDHVHVVQERIERFHVREGMHAAVLSARAVAPLDKLFGMANHLSDEKTLWLLPKGRNAHLELETARQGWQAAFHVEHSVTDPDSSIVVARNLQRISIKQTHRSSARSRKA